MNAAAWENRIIAQPLGLAVWSDETASRTARAEASVEIRRRIRLAVMYTVPMLLVRLFPFG